MAPSPGNFRMIPRPLQYGENSNILHCIIIIITNVTGIRLVVTAVYMALYWTGLSILC